MTEALTIIGGGRVGRALGRKLRERGWKIAAVVTRSQASARRAARFIGAGQPFGSLTRQAIAPRVFLAAVPDRELEGVAVELARIGGEELGDKVVLHTSGSLDSRILEPVRKLGAAAGSIHPLQTFSGIGVPPLEGRVLAIEGDAAALRVARRISRSLGGMPVPIEAEKKPLYHAACTLAAGHSLAVIEAATRLLMSLGMKRREALRALLPLTRQVLDNFERLGPAKAWTGPLARGDYEVIAAHTAALGEFPAEFTEAHEALNQLGAVVLARQPEEVQRALDHVFRGQKTLRKATGGNL